MHSLYPPISLLCINPREMCPWRHKQECSLQQYKCNNKLEITKGELQKENEQMLHIYKKKFYKLIGMDE